MIGKFEILGPCGEGGMSLVSKAHDRYLDRLVAIKQMAPKLEEDTEAIDAFRREARILAQLDHPNIVHVHEYLEQDHHHYLIMGYIEGEHLGRMIHRGPMEPALAVRILEQVLKGLQTMHSKGIIHQDVKPSNILMDKDLIPKIADFGLATSANESDPKLSWGSSQYLAPELLSSPADASYLRDPRVDIYALGMVAYQMFLGEKEFRNQCKEIYSDGSELTNTDKEIADKWRNWQRDSQRHLPLLSSINAKVDRHLAEIVDRMLKKDRQSRYADAGAILKDLREPPPLNVVAEDDPDKTMPLPEIKPKPGDRPPPERSAGRQKPRSQKLLYLAGAVSVLTFLFLVSRRPPELVPVMIQSTPGAEVSIDQKSWGKIPTSGLLHGKISAGSHTARLVLKNYEAFEATSEVKQSGRWDVLALLKPISPPQPVTPALAERRDLQSGAMLLIPAGEFLYGSDKKKAILPAFYMDETEVTNGAYRKFCDVTGHAYPPNPFWDPDYFLAKDRDPVLNVTWDDAVAFAEWAGKRLPTELEWEKAARGTDGRTWPWGSDFDPHKANLGGNEDGFVFTSPVGAFPTGKSPYGMLDMAGNVWEWVASPYVPSNDLGENDRILKGGSFVKGIGQKEAATFFHGTRPRSDRPNSVGFRCAKDAPISPAQQGTTSAAPPSIPQQ